MDWNKTAAGTHARQNAGASSQRRCGEFVRRAILAGGVNLPRTEHAKDFGRTLESVGFKAIGAGQPPIEGDVVVIQPYSIGNASGHTAIFDGTTWFSDFMQRDMWGGLAIDVCSRHM